MTDDPGVRPSSHPPQRCLPELGLGQVAGEHLTLLDQLQV